MEHEIFWHGLKVGDWATWFAVIITFLAVCTAIGIPWIQWCKERKKRHEHEARSAQILAIEMCELFLRLRRDMVNRRSIFQEADKGYFNANVPGLIAQSQLKGFEELPHGADLQNLPYPVAPAIAALRANIAMYNGMVGRLIEFLTTKTMADAVNELKLPNMLNASQAALARAAHHLGKYDPSYGLIDYLDKGDGTRVNPLQDYGDER